MASWPERACTALTVYFERGVRALELLQDERWDEADAILNLRKAAFHNFRSADFLALKSGYSKEQEAQLREIWAKIVEIDGKLMAAMESSKQKMEGEIARLVKVKATFSRFRSGQVQESNIEKPV